MLGINKTPPPQVEGHYAKSIRAAAVRAHTGKLNAQDMEIRKRSDKILHEYQVEVK